MAKKPHDTTPQGILESAHSATPLLPRYRSEDEKAWDDAMRQYEGEFDRGDRFALIRALAVCSKYPQFGLPLWVADELREPLLYYLYTLQQQGNLFESFFNGETKQSMACIHQRDSKSLTKASLTLDAVLGLQGKLSRGRPRKESAELNTIRRSMDKLRKRGKSTLESAEIVEPNKTDAGQQNRERDYNRWKSKGAKTEAIIKRLKNQH